MLQWVWPRRDEVSVAKVAAEPWNLGRLVWQAWHQTWHMSAWIAAAVLAIGVLFTFDSPSPVVTAVATIIGASLLGSTVFLGDQERHLYRFFAEHGVGARRVWLSRQIVGIGVALAVAAVSVGLMSLVNFHALRRPRAESWMESWATFSLVAAATTGLVILAYASGQFFSMLLRNGLLAGFFGLLLTVLVCAWAALMVAIGFHPAWSAVPIPLVFLLATWLARRTGWWNVTIGGFGFDWHWWWPCLCCALGQLLPCCA